jgi:hypothetical protein
MTPPNKPPAPVQHPATQEGLLRELIVRINGVAKTTERIADKQIEHGQRLQNIEGDVAELKGHVIAAKASTRQTSQNDATQDAAIATLTTNVAALTKTQTEQLNILKRLDKVATNPTVVKVAKAVGQGILIYLAAKGLVPK